MELELHEIERRTPVWEVLSRLFLDTEHEREELMGFAGELAGAGYSVEELEDMLFDEVYPVCAGNLSDPLGDWMWYDAGWLRGEILRWPERRTKGIRRAWRRARLRRMRGDWWEVVRGEVIRVEAERRERERERDVESLNVKPHD